MSSLPVTPPKKRCLICSQSRNRVINDGNLCRKCSQDGINPRPHKQSSWLSCLSAQTGTPDRSFLQSPQRLQLENNSIKRSLLYSEDSSAYDPASEESKALDCPKQIDEHIENSMDVTAPGASGPPLGSRVYIENSMGVKDSTLEVENTRIPILDYIRDEIENQFLEFTEEFQETKRTIDQITGSTQSSLDIMKQTLSDLQDRFDNHATEVLESKFQDKDAQWIERLELRDAQWTKQLELRDAQWTKQLELQEVAWQTRLDEIVAISKNLLMTNLTQSQQEAEDRIRIELRKEIENRVRTESEIEDRLRIELRKEIEDGVRTEREIEDRLRDESQQETEHRISAESELENRLRSELQQEAGNRISAESELENRLRSELQHETQNRIQTESQLEDRLSIKLQQDIESRLTIKFQQEIEDRIQTEGQLEDRLTIKFQQETDNRLRNELELENRLRSKTERFESEMHRFLLDERQTSKQLFQVQLQSLQDKLETYKNEGLNAQIQSESLIRNQIETLQNQLNLQTTLGKAERVGAGFYGAPTSGDGPLHGPRPMGRSTFASSPREAGAPVPSSTTLFGGTPRRSFVYEGPSNLHAEEAPSRNDELGPVPSPDELRPYTNGKPIRLEVETRKELSGVLPPTRAPSPFSTSPRAPETPSSNDSLGSISRYQSQDRVETPSIGEGRSVGPVIGIPANMIHPANPVSYYPTTPMRRETFIHYETPSSQYPPVGTSRPTTPYTGAPTLQNRSLQSEGRYIGVGTLDLQSPKMGSTIEQFLPRPPSVKPPSVRLSIRPPVPRAK
jgi:hypothetical protein